MDQAQFARIAGGQWSLAPWDGWRYRGLSVNPDRYRPGDVVIQQAPEDPFASGWTVEEIETAAPYPFCVIAARDAGPLSVAVPLLRVERLWDALESLAKDRVDQFSGVTVAVTGSVGKSSTCRMLGQVLARGGACFRNGQRNTPSGVLAAAASLNTQSAAVLEVAASAIPHVSNLLRPQISAVTSIAEAHTQQFGDLEGVAERKSGLFESQAPGALALVNADMPLAARVEAAARQRGLRVVRYGVEKDCDVRLADYDARSGVLEVDVAGVVERFPLGMRGEHMAVNALVTVAVARELGISLDQVRSALRGVREVPGRGNTLHLRGVGPTRRVRILNNAYNANAASVEASLRRFRGEPVRRGAKRIAVLGDMLELGERSAEAHRRVGEAVRESGVGTLIYVGEQADQVSEGCGADVEIHRAEDVEAATRLLAGIVADGDAILLQASNGVELHRLPRELLQDAERWSRDTTTLDAAQPSWSCWTASGARSWRGRRRLRPARLTRLFALGVLLAETGADAKRAAGLDDRRSMARLLRDGDGLLDRAARAGWHPYALAARTTAFAEELGMRETVVADISRGGPRSRTTADDVARLGAWLTSALPEYLEHLLPRDRRAARLVGRGYPGLFLAGSTRHGFHAITVLPSRLDPRVLFVGGAASAAACVSTLTIMAEEELS